jgi:uncharacterized protein
MRIISIPEYRETPWKNGGGITTEIYSTGRKRFDWRASIATVAASGPFSNFAGFDRHIMVMEGDGMSLEVDGERHILAPMVPFSFLGDSNTESQIMNGPVRDFNLMVRREFGVGRLSLANRSFFSSGDNFMLIHHVNGDSVLLEPGEEFRFKVPENVILCEITPHSLRR